jgi:6-phosphogluconate dehydrogenase (decarboxylating)
MTKPVIGFTGPGVVGGNMVENLQDKGFEPIVMDLNRDAVAAVVARSGSEAASAAELAAIRDKRQTTASRHYLPHAGSSHGCTSNDASQATEKFPVR